MIRLFDYGPMRVAASGVRLSDVLTLKGSCAEVAKGYMHVNYAFKVSRLPYLAAARLSCLCQRFAVTAGARACAGAAVPSLLSTSPATVVAPASSGFSLA